MHRPERQPVLEDIGFPVGFAWAAATAAYQIEGAEGWNADGNGPNVWDILTHQGGDRVFKNQTGDVACGSYTLWEEDLKCIKQLGLTHYCFSLSWSRLLPDGTTGFINQKRNCFLKIEGVIAAREEWVENIEWSSSADQDPEESDSGFGGCLASSQGQPTTEAYGVLRNLTMRIGVCKFLLCTRRANISPGPADVRVISAGQGRPGCTAVSGPCRGQFQLLSAPGCRAASLLSPGICHGASRVARQLPAALRPGPARLWAVVGTLWQQNLGLQQSRARPGQRPVPKPGAREFSRGLFVLGKYV
ncbi:PREDICTED: uncharacterized protein LOC102108673 [Pseudopodoces humilis]|uniref:uncharacterized protein LOC102108673 n=1 Tax=Pseudopodoces humilis TaxID=181119 RepID=UPI00039575E5|nr:PREDICTED: uncharacterized protein LOC102108673 [Pseudopodoces humilis]